MILTLTKCTRPSGVFSVEHGFALIGQPHFFLHVGLDFRYDFSLYEFPVWTAE